MLYLDRLNAVAELYRKQGLRVVVNPTADDLPVFGKDFQVELVGTGPNLNVIATVKPTRARLEADLNLVHYAEVIEQHPDWRYDIHVLGGEGQPPAPKQRPAEPSDEQIREQIDTAERLLGLGFADQAFVSAWAVLDAVMRQRLRLAGEPVDWDTSPCTALLGLYTIGIISLNQYHELTGMWQSQNVIVRGFAPGDAVDAGVVRSIVQTASQLLSEPQPPPTAAA